MTVLSTVDCVPGGCIQHKNEHIDILLLGFSGNPFSLLTPANVTGTTIPSPRPFEQQNIPRNKSMKAAKKSINTFAKTFLDLQASDEQSVGPSQLQRGKQLYPPELNSQHNIAGEELLQVAALLLCLVIGGSTHRQELTLSIREWCAAARARLLHGKLQCCGERAISNLC